MPYKDPEKARASARESSRKWREKNKEYSREKSRQWARENPERHRQNAKNWKENNPEKVRAYTEANKERLYASFADWAKRNPEHRRSYYHRYRAKKAGAAGPGVFPSDWAAITEVFGGACAYCLKPCASPTRDHVVALCLGGDDSPENVVPACPECNSLKSYTTLIDWVRRSGTANP